MDNGMYQRHPFVFHWPRCSNTMWMGSHGAAEPDTNQQACKPHCEFCNTEISDFVGHFRCAHCGVNYCSKEHKKADFRFHKHRCPNFPDTQSRNDSNSNPTECLSHPNSQQFENDYSSIQSLPASFQQKATPGFTGQPLAVQEPCHVDMRNPTSLSLFSSSISQAQVDPSASSSMFQQSLNAQQYNSQFYPVSQTQPSSFQPQQPTIQTNETPAPLFSIAQTVTIESAPIQIPNTDDAQIPLDDALMSFLQDADQYDSLAEDSLDFRAEGKLPRNLSGFLRDLTKQTEEQLFYDQLLSLDSSSTDSGKTKTMSDNVVMKDGNAEILMQSTSGLSSAVNCSEQVSARMCEQFKLQKQDSSDIIAGNPTLEEQGIFPRFNLNDVAEYVVNSLNANNHCIIDFLHGASLATAILEEVKQFHNENAFSEGRLSSPGGKKGTANKAVREDLVAWTDGKSRQAIRKHMGRLDFLMKLCNRHVTECEISSRTQAMVACYPGKGTGYKQHIDNPNKDGRCITTLYYLNPNWNIKTDGGILRLFPSGIVQKTVYVEPIFDRLLLFWSDRRTPHEVTSAYKVRYAITLWYFNDEERKDYIQRYKEGKT